MSTLMRLLAAACAAPLLTGCALFGARSPATPAVAAPAAPALPEAWQAPLPHGGQPAELARWWSQFDDAALPRLVLAAQAASPTLASAASRIEQARAARAVAGAALGPRLDGGLSVTRAKVDTLSPIATSAGAQLAASWELDVFGAAAAGRDAAQARLDSALAGWHDARVLVAAETAQQLLALRACEAQLEQAQADAASRAETARLTGLTERAGFQSPANAALARASAAQGRSAAEAQRAGCESLFKGLVALSALDEAALRTELAARSGRLPQPATLAVEAVPARVLAQRPDLAAAARDVAAAAAELSQARAQRLPSLSLAGSVGRARVSSGGFTQNGNVWSLGPLQLSLPIFDGGRLAAGEAAAQARYVEAGALYRARLRQAVREVEDALVQLDSARRRDADVRAAAEDFQRSLRGTEARYRGGLASLFELEDARRSAVQAQGALIELQRQQVTAWIALYKALGGGWTPDAPAAS